MNSIIEANKVRKEYKIYESRSGIAGHFKDIFKRNYKKISAVKDINLLINSGEIVGYIGLNGAGKSTTIKMLTGIMKPTSGSIKICGVNPYENRKKISKKISVVFGQKTHLWADLPVHDSFELIKNMYEISDEDYENRINWIKQFLDFDEIWNQQVRKLSLGQKMLCEIAVCLIYNPEVLFLDEPTIGLDVLVKSKVIDLIKELNRTYGTTVIVTSHDLKDIEKLCSRIVMIDKGKIIYDGPLGNVYYQNFTVNVITFYAETTLKEKLFKDILNQYKITINNNELRLEYDAEKNKIPMVISDVLKCYNKFYDMKLEKEDLEEIVKKIYGSQEQDEN